MAIEMAMEGVASLALLPSGSVSGHFVHPSTSTCLALFGTEIPCERECSKGQDYRLIDLTIHDFRTKREAHVIVECRGEDAARFSNVESVHGWQEDVIKKAEKKKEMTSTPFISFECDVLKSDKDSEEHIRRFLPSLAGLGAVVNIGTMIIRGLDLDSQREDKIGKERSPSSGELLPSSVEFSTSAISGIEHTDSACICREDVDTARVSSKLVPPCNTLRSIVFGKSRYFSVDEELHDLVKEELEAEGLSSEPLEFLWEEDALGWRTKRRCGKGSAVSVGSSIPIDIVSEESS